MNPTPSLAIENSLYLLTRYSIPQRDIFSRSWNYASLGTSSECMASRFEFLFGSNRSDNIFCNFSHTIGFSFRLAIFRNLISNIVSMRTDKKVIWIDTLGVVASMAYDKSFWNRTKSYFPLKSAGYIISLMWIPGCKYSIPLLRKTCIPRPASVSNCIFSSKPFYQSRVHNKDYTSRGAAQ